MNILLTGYKGFIGNHVLTALEAAGHCVSTYDWGDSLPSVMEQDWVIHLGAISSTTERDIDKVMRQNFDFSRQLYDACKTYGVNFQYASSASVYGLTSTFREDAPVDPRTPYAWSKYLFERYVRDHPSGSVVQGFRYFNVYGPEGEEHKGNQASPFMQFKRQAETNGCIQVFEGSEYYLRDFVHVSKLVDTHLDFLYNTPSGLWNLGTGKTMSFMDVAKSFNVPVETIPMPDNLKDSYQKYTCADMSKFNATVAERPNARDCKSLKS
jgi:ADP-L-glycero-D-manno-heptose 6-epimerase